MSRLWRFWAGTHGRLPAANSAPEECTEAARAVCGTLTRAEEEAFWEASIKLVERSERADRSEPGEELEYSLPQPIMAGVVLAGIVALILAAYYWG